MDSSEACISVSRTQAAGSTGTAADCGSTTDSKTTACYASGNPSALITTKSMLQATGSTCSLSYCRSVAWQLESPMPSLGQAHELLLISLVRQRSRKRSLHVRIQCCLGSSVGSSLKVHTEAVLHPTLSWKGNPTYTKLRAVQGADDGFFHASEAWPAGIRSRPGHQRPRAAMPFSVESSRIPSAAAVLA